MIIPRSAITALMLIFSLLIVGVECGCGDPADPAKISKINLLSPSEYYTMRSREGAKTEQIGAELRDAALRNQIQKCITAGTAGESASRAFGQFALAEAIDAPIFMEVFRQFFDSWLLDKELRKLGFALSYIDERHPDWQWLKEDDYIRILNSNEFAKLFMLKSGLGAFPLLVNMSKFEKWKDPESIGRLIDDYLAIIQNYEEDPLKIGEILEGVRERLK